MLIIGAYVNKQLIDKVLIHNIGRKTKNGRNIYEIVKPKGYEKINVYHHYENSWKVLTAKVLDLIIKKRTRKTSDKSLQDVNVFVDGLVVAAFVNSWYIDRVCIYRTKQVTKNGRSIYEIEKSNDDEKIKIYCQSDDDWLDITAKALRAINKN